MNRLLQLLRTWWCEPPCRGAEIQKHGRADADFWDVALRADEEVRPAREPGRIEYRFLGVTGEEET